MISSREILAALTAPAFGTLDPVTRTEGVEATIKRTYALKGLIVSGDVEKEVTSSARLLADRIAARWPGLTMGEIALALEAGVCGDYPGDRRLTVSNYLSWLNAYVHSDERRDAVRLLAERKPSVALLPETDRKRRNEESLKGQALAAWKRFSEDGETGISLDGRAAAVYDYLEGLGKIKARPETIEKARQRAKRSEDGGIYQKAGGSTSEAGKWAIKRELLEMYFEALRGRGAELRL